MQHLFASVVEILENKSYFEDGTPTYRWEPITLSGGATTCRCRIDTTFQPIGSLPPVIEAGRAPDRMATVWFGPAEGLQVKPGMRLRCVGGPITGTWSIDELGDQVGGFSGLHHVEFYVKEVAQSIARTS